jgi:hypothetical protein
MQSPIIKPGALKILVTSDRSTRHGPKPAEP